MSSKDILSMQKKLIIHPKEIPNKTSIDNNKKKITSLTESITSDKKTYDKEKENYEILSCQIIDKEIILNQIDDKANTLKRKLLLSLNLINNTFISHFKSLYNKVNPSIIEGMSSFFGCEVANSFLMEKLSTSILDMNNMIELSFLYQKKKNEDKDPNFLITKKRIFQIGEENKKLFLYPYDILYGYFKKIYKICENETRIKELIYMIEKMNKEKTSCYTKMGIIQKEITIKENSKMLLMNQIKNEDEYNNNVSSKRLHSQEVIREMPNKKIVKNKQPLINQKKKNISINDMNLKMKQYIIQSSSRKPRISLIKNTKPILTTSMSKEKSVNNSEIMYKYLTTSTNTNVHSQCNSVSYSRMTTYSKEKTNNTKQTKNTTKNNLPKKNNFKTKVPTFSFNNNIKLIKIQDHSNKNTPSLYSSFNKTEKEFKESLLGQPTKRTVFELTKIKNHAIFIKFKDEMLIEFTNSDLHLPTEITNDLNKRHHSIEPKADKLTIDKSHNANDNSLNNDIITKGTKETDSSCCVSCT